MRAWLKGGLIGGGIGVIVSIIFLMSVFMQSSLFGLQYIIILAIPLTISIAYVTGFLLACHGEECMGAWVWSLVISLIITLFLIGAIVGLLIQKIKSRRN